MIDRFASPLWLLLLLLIPFFWWMLRRPARHAAMLLPPIERLDRVPRTFRQRLRWLPTAFRAVGLALLAFALARPQETSGESQSLTEGVAIEIVIDRSSTMSEPMRAGGGAARKIDVVKELARTFIAGNGDDLPGREADLIGLTAFARYADTICPLTQGAETVASLVDRIELVERRSEDGTAIGEALALAAARLRAAEEQMTRRADESGGATDFKINSKIVVLLTDGVNNAGQIEPHQVAELAREWGIRIYTIGVGQGGGVLLGGGFDERSLLRIAEMTDGRYFRAQSAESLLEVYAAIDELEKTKIETLEYTHVTELFRKPAAAAGIALAIEMVFSVLFFRRAP